MAVTTATIFIPDISGYTSFMSQMEIEHGSYIINQLFESIIANTDQHFTISEVEGDALLLYAKAITLSKKVVLNQCLKMFDGFHKRRKTLHERNECNCNACAGIEKLTLKFIIHYGTIYELKISRFLKPSGIDVIIAHRLLKNKIYSHEYILMTNGFLSHAEDGGARDWIPYTLKINGLQTKCVKFVSQKITITQLCCYYSLSTYQYKFNEPVMIYSD